MSIRAPQGTLNIPNAILRVGKLELDDASGFDTALNTIARNTILLEDLGPYDSGNKQWGLKVPNIFVATFEIQGVSAFNFMNTVNGDANTGYTLEFSGTTLTLKYDGVNLTTATIPNLDSTYGKVYLTYEKQYFTVTIDGTRVLEYKDTTTRTPPTNGEYINFFAGESGSPRFKNLKIVNGNWITDGTSNISYVGGNVSLSEGLDVSGNVEVGTSNLFVDTTTGKVTMNETKISSNLEVGTANLFVDTTTGKVTMNETKISSNLEVGTSNLFVDTLTGRVGIGKTDPGAALDVAGDVEVVGKLTASGSEAPIRWNCANETAFPQNDGQKYWKIATLGTTGTGGNFGELRIKGIIGGATSDRITGINASITTRGGLSVYGNLDGYGVGGNGPKNYTDIVVYEETGGAFTVYLKTNDYFKFDIILLGGTTDSFKTIRVFPCPTTSGTNVTPTGTLVTASVIDECSVVFADNGNVGIGTTNPGTAKLRIDLDTITSDSQHLIMHAKYENANDGYLEFLETNHTPAQNDWLGWGTRIQKVVDVTRQGYIEFNPVGDGYDIAFGNDGGGGSGEIMRIDGVNGRVGIGTTDPNDRLHVNGGISFDEGLRSTSSTVRLRTSQSSGNWIQFQVSGDSTNDILDIQALNNSAKISTRNSQSLYLNTQGGSVGICTTTTSARVTLQMANGNVLTGTGLRFIQQAGSNRWDLGTSTSTDQNFVFGYNGGSKAYLNHATGNSQINFTGQHRTFIKDIPFTEAVKLEGLIVSADQNKYIKMSGGIEAGSNAITTNESLPIVSLSVTAKDKKCFGVISTSEDPETREEKYGNFVSVSEKENGDTRVYINSVGEGAIWVVNTNGNLESGDYITTSNVMGYGQKQDDDILHNYTVAKITMDCDFNPVTQSAQIIRKELSNVNYWVKTIYDNVSEEEYSNLTDENRRTITKLGQIIYQKVSKEETKIEEKDWEPVVRKELVNVLDEHGQIQWEDDPSGATEKAYKIRYLDADGNITDEANHVYKAAFVGCTYHCG